MKTKQEYIDTLVCITKEYYSTVRSPEEVNKFNSYLRLFEGLVDEHFGGKKETNFEHYKDEIISIGSDFAVRNEEVVPCKGCRCLECCFNGGDFSCCTKRMIWLYQKYKEKVKLTQFEYDLINTYSDCNANCKFSDCKQLRKLKDKGYFESIDYDTKVHDILANCEVIK